MRRLLVLSIVGMSVLGAVRAAEGAATTRPAAAQAASSDLLTAQEIRKLVDAGQWQAGLHALVRVLDLKGDAAADYDMHEMWMLKAECLLQIREAKGAIEALKVAVANATKENNEDHLMQANALMELIQKSPSNFYTPKTAAIKKPIPILDRELRKSAYEALFNDEFAEFKKLVKTAMATMVLQPTLDAAKAAVGMRSVERMATGSNKQTEEVTGQLATHSVKMINTALDDLATQSQRIRERANTLITQDVTETVNGRSYDHQVSHRRGLSGDDGKVLQNVMDTCTKIPPVMEEMAKWLGTQQDAFHVASLKANNIKRDADHTLHDDYRGVVHE